jgi:hypothetical protein
VGSKLDADSRIGSSTSVAQSVISHSGSIFEVSPPGTVFALGQEQVPQLDHTRFRLQLFEERNRLPSVALIDLGEQLLLVRIDVLAMKASMRRGPQRGVGDLGQRSNVSRRSGCEAWSSRRTAHSLIRWRSTPPPRSSARYPVTTPNSVSNSIRTGIIRSPPTRRAYQIFPRL